MIPKTEIAIIGAGMAGASLAYEIAPYCDVTLLEAEERPGMHSTGRSAAFWSASYGGPLVAPLTRASYGFLAEPPADFAEEGFLRRRGTMIIADEAGQEALAEEQRLFAGSALELTPVGRAEIEAAIPGIRPGWDTALFDESCSDIDVARLHAAYLGGARRRGVRLQCDARLVSAEPARRGWLIETPGGSLYARVLINAAGAWADEVAAACGLAPLGITPYRRTIAQLRIDPTPPRALPLVVDALGRFYFKPDAGRLWLSPHDETPCPAMDCAPEEEDVALAIDRLERVVDWKVERVEHRWAGLRSFAPDRLPVYGWDARARNFFWFAGQGGFGIQTAPAAACLAAALLGNQTEHPSVRDIDPTPYLAERLVTN